MGLNESTKDPRPENSGDAGVEIGIDDLGRILERIGEAAVLVNLTTRIILKANDEFFRLSGFSTADIGTLDLLRLHDLNDLERVLNTARSPDASGIVLPAVSCSSKNGSFFPADLRVTSFTEGEGALVLLTYHAPAAAAARGNAASHEVGKHSLVTYTQMLAAVRDRNSLERALKETSTALMASDRLLLVTHRGAKQGTDLLVGSGFPDQVMEGMRDWLGRLIGSGLLAMEAPRLVPDLAKEEGVAPLREALEESGTRALVVFPLESENRILGAWVLGFQGEPWARACGLELGQTLAAHLSGTVAGVLALERTVKEKEHHEVLNRIMGWLRGPLDLEGILQSLTLELCSTLKADRCVILTTDPSDGEAGSTVHVEAEHHADGLTPVKPQGAIPFGTTSLGTALLYSKEPLTVEDIQMRPDLTEDRESQDTVFGLRGFILAKIVAKQEFVGLVAVGTAGHPGSWSAEEIDLVRAVADHAAVTLETGRLARDSHERAEQIERERREWERTFDAIPDMVSIHDGYGRMLRANLAMQVRLGGDPRGYVGKECDLILEAVMGRSSGCPHEEAKGARRAVAREIQGELGVFALTAIPCFDAAGQCLYIIHVCKEITEEKQIREQLLQTEKMAAVGNLVSGVAHELNNPLAGVIGFSEILLEKPLDAKVRKSVESISDEEDRASRIVRNLLTFARKHKPESMMSDLNSVLEKTIELRAYELRVRKIKVTMNLDKKVPKTLADPNQLLQVFMNVITNAEQAMVDANNRGALELSTTRVDDHIRITIKDDGPGIPPETLKKIFDPFFTTKPIGKGTGLGLSICHGIIKGHNGRISANSTVGGGTTFTIDLPILTGPETRAEVKPTTTEKAPAATILVVDDEPSIRDMIQDALTGRGHTVDSVDSGLAALKALATKSYDLIVSDVKMPEMDGQEMYARITKEYPHLALRVLFTSGDTVSAETIDFFEKTERPYLLKPFKVANLIAEAEKILREFPKQVGRRTG